MTTIGDIQYQDGPRILSMRLDDMEGARIRISDFDIKASVEIGVSRDNLSKIRDYIDRVLNERE